MTARPEITPAEFVELLSAICDETGSDIYEGYSGRSMYGARCWGISCERHAMAEGEGLAIELGLGEANHDNLGLSMIVYWPQHLDGANVFELAAPGESDEEDFGGNDGCEDDPNHIYPL